MRSVAAEYCALCRDGLPCGHDRRRMRPPPSPPSPTPSARPSLDLDQLTQLVGLVEYDASTDPFPVTGLGRRGLRRRQRDPDRPLLPVGLRHGAGRLLGPGDRQPRPQGVRAQERLVPVRHQGRSRPGQPAARPPPGPRRRRLRHRPRGSRRRPVHRARPRLRAPGWCRSRHDVTDEHGTVRIASIAAYGDTRALARRPLRLRRALPARLRRADVRRTSSATAHRSGCSRPSTTWSATSSSATWTSGSASTTR